MIFFLAKKILKLLSKLASKNRYEFSSDMSDEDAVRNIGYLAHELRKTRKTGPGVPVYSLKLAIAECGKIVRRKKSRGVKVFDFEEWISDNERLLLGSLKTIDYKALSLLPHTDGLPRIVILADFIVKYSGGNVKKERIKTVLDAFNAVTPLTFPELLSLKDAVTYRLLAEISYFAERSIAYYDAYLRAFGKKLSARDCSSDSYMTFYAEAHPQDIKGPREGEFRSAALGFENLLADNLLLTSSYINSLRKVGREISDDFIVSLAPTDAIYLKEESYREMSAAAKTDYLRQTAKCAEKSNVSEAVLALSCLSLAAKLGVHFGEILYYYPRALGKYLRFGVAEPLRDEKTKVQGIYSFLVLFISLIVAAFPAYYLRTMWAYLSVVPIFIACLHPVEYLLKRAYSFRLKRKPLPQMDYDVLPPECKTVVTVCRFLSGKEDLKDALFQAETLAVEASDPAISVAVVADLPAADEEWGEKDREIETYLNDIPTSKKVSVFIRKRVKEGGKWRPYERKRGAILDFLSAVDSGDFSKFRIWGKTMQASYAVLLDDDSEVMPGTITSSILAMAHPLNAEYDLMSFGGKINRFSIRTHYALRFLRGCGTESYPYYSDFYADAFDCALYCGKAIVRIRRYLDKLSGFFPDGRVLSHDIIEGAVLRSTSLKRCVYEDAPADFSADYSRSARWQRGDVQLLPYAFCNKVKNRLGNRIKNPISPIYKLIIFINGVSVLRDFFTLCVLVFAYVSGDFFLGLYMISVFLFVKVYALVLSLQNFFRNVRFSHSFRVFLQSVEIMTEEILLLPFRALSGIYLFAITSLKMAFRSKTLLEWKPFRSTQKLGSVGEGAKVLLPTVVFLSALCVLLGNLWITLYTVCFFLFSFYLLISSRKIQTQGIKRVQKEKMKSYAEKIYRYFSDQSDDALITDNVQLFPYRMTSPMTSPTNLGFQLLAEVCAAKIGLIDEKTALFNIGKQLDKIDRLEKYHGHLYNWYDIKSFRVMPPNVVSTVDSANFLTCVSVVQAFADEAGDQIIKTRANALYEATDFSILYDRSEKCLAIVKQTHENTLVGRYDLLASESRLAYYIAISQGVPTECYFSLGREYGSFGGNTLLSWSGTAFEYMLPRIFLKAPIGSLIETQERRSGAAQKKEVTQGVFGRSECGYYAFNDATAFQYKAVGCSSLAMSGERSDVVSPYASFLYLPCMPESCLRNLDSLSRLNTEGEYGFFEAIDFDAGDVVKSFMTHHQGMSLAAIANALTGDEIVRLYASLPRVNAVRLLLTEEDGYLRRQKYLPRVSFPEKQVSEVVATPKRIPETLSVGCGEYFATYDALGRSGARLKENRLTKATDYLTEYGGIFVEIKEGDRLFSPTYYPKGDENCYAVFSDHSVKYCNPLAGVTMEVRPLDGYQGEIRKIVLENDSDEKKKVILSAYADMVLNSDDAYVSHPAFSDMFVSAEYDDSTFTQYLTRRNDHCKKVLSASLMAKGLSDLSVNCNSYNVIGRCGDAFVDYESGVKKEDAPKVGDVLYPCFSFCGIAEIPPRQKSIVYLVFLADRDESLLKERNRKIDLAYRSGAIELLGKPSVPERENLALSLSLTGRMLYQRTPQNVLLDRIKHQNELSALGLTPQDFILYYDCEEALDKKRMISMIDVSKSIRESGINHRLVITAEDLVGAGMSGLEAIEKAAKERDESVFVLSKAKGAIVRNAANVVLSLPIEEPKEPLQEKAYLLPDQDASSMILTTCGEGGFSADGYVVHPFGAHPLLPYANVVGAKKGGFVVTENGGGFTFLGNAREEKLTVWTGDALRDYATERVLLSYQDKKYALNANHCEHRIGSTVFSHLMFGSVVRVCVCPLDDGAAKLYEVLFSADIPAGCYLSIEMIPALGWRFGEHIAVSAVDGGFLLKNAGTNRACYLSTPERISKVFIPEIKSERIEFRICEEIKKGVYRFILSDLPPTEMGERDIAASRAKSIAQAFSNAVTVKTEDGFLDRLNNRSLPYQLTSARLNAKTGFYQCSGAYGFRDQLQDTLGLLLSDPGRVKEQILLCAAHQYSEGDVQHWWHPPMTGVRTRISDDRLWLVYVTERYLDVTEDYLLLDQAVPFLSSPILKEKENSRYEIPREGEVGTIREHLLRAIRISLQYGEHGIVKIGTGDWNDGLDRVGDKGRGESVWLQMFSVKVIGDALRFFRDDVRSELSSEVEKMRSALLPLFKEGRFPLAFADDGKWLGYSEGTACRLALNPQTWAVLSGAVSSPEAKRTLSTARGLVDGEYGVIKLCSPPFDERTDYGYISSYPKGIRENGGQYTHAAVWYFKALLEVGEKDEAYRVLSILNPMVRCKNEKGTRLYKGEPYVLAGDVYGSDPYLGRAGWTWYTGSAGWLKYVLTEDFFGIKKRGNKLFVKPVFPSFFKELTAVVAFPDRSVTIRYVRSEEEGLFENDRKIEYLDLSEQGEVELLCRFR